MNTEGCITHEMHLSRLYDTWLTYILFFSYYRKMITVRLRDAWTNISILNKQAERNNTSISVTDDGVQVQNRFYHADHPGKTSADE